MSTSTLLILFALSRPACAAPPPAMAPMNSTVDVCVGVDGSLTVVGTFVDSVSFGADPAPIIGAGGGDAFVARYDAAGTLDWSLAIGGKNHDEGRSIAAMSDGGVVVTGLYRGGVEVASGEKTISLEAKMDEARQFLVRISATGSVVWAQSFGVRDQELLGVDSHRLPFDVAVGRDDAIFFVGTPPGDERSASALVGKLDRDGKALWVSSFGARETVLPHCVTPFGDGCLVGGRAALPNDMPRAPEMLVMSFDAEGNESWERRWSGNWLQVGSSGGGPEMNPSTGFAEAIATDGKRLILVAGSMVGTVDFDPKKRSKRDTLHAEGSTRQAFVLMLDALGEYRGVFPVEPRSPGVIEKRVTGSECRDIALAADGTITVTGSRRGFQAVKGRDLLLEHLFVERYKKGRKVWSTYWDPKIPMIHAGGQGLALHSDGTVFVTGFAPPSEEKGVFARQGKGVILSLSKKGKPVELGE